MNTDIFISLLMILQVSMTELIMKNDLSTGPKKSVKVI